VIEVRTKGIAVAAVVLSWAFLSVGSDAQELRDGAEVIRAMHRRYANNWYKTLTFQQDSITHNADGSDKSEVWYEAMLLPGKLRIDIGKPDSGNGTLIADGTLTTFQKNEVTASRPFVHMLLLLGFDVYAQSPDVTIAHVKSKGFTLSKMHEDTWEGKPVYVIGADKGDLKSNQFWIEKERLLFVRLIEPNAKEPAKVNDTRFGDYRPLSRGWVAARVDFYVDGKNEFSEVYSNIVEDPKLDAGFFDPKQLKLRQRNPQGISYGENPDASKRMTLLLKDFHPKPMPHAAKREFFDEFQDRIMFGTDERPLSEMYANFFRWLETDDEYFLIGIIPLKAAG